MHFVPQTGIYDLMHLRTPSGKRFLKTYGQKINGPGDLDRRRDHLIAFLDLFILEGIAIICFSA